MSRVELHLGDALAVLRGLPSGSVHCCVTSPPYFGLRDYHLPPTLWGDGWVGCLGLEPTPAQYVEHLVEVFAEVRRVLRDDGSLWLNLGDSYATHRNDHDWLGSGALARRGWHGGPGLKSKDLIGIPWAVAFALRSDGWWLRSEIIWAKKAPMPESVRDRPTRAHEQVFLLAKSAIYYYDADAVREPLAGNFEPNFPRTVFDNAPPPPPGQPPHRGLRRYRAGNGFAGRQGGSDRVGPQNGGTGSAEPWKDDGSGRNRRSVWTLGPEPSREEHFAAYPSALVEPCILAGCPEGGTVLDPFLGSGTTGAVAVALGRRFVGIDLNPGYMAMAERRIAEYDVEERQRRTRSLREIAGPLFAEPAP